MVFLFVANAVGIAVVTVAVAATDAIFSLCACHVLSEFVYGNCRRYLFTGYEHKTYHRSSAGNAAE